MDGAGLIAQILPVGLLIVAVERRALGGRLPPKRGSGRVGWLVRGIGLLTTVTLSVVAVWVCVAAVSQSRGLGDWESILVFVAGGTLAFVALDTTISLTIRSYAGVLGKADDNL